MNFVLVKKSFKKETYEFVEKKGRGHPDTLSDGLGEFLSAKYSQYTLKRFGAVLHHNFDKTALLGGSSNVGFGYGTLIKPIRVLLNGRASTEFGSKEIPVKELLIDWSINFLTRELPLKMPKNELEFHYNLSTQSSPGKTEEESNLNKSSRRYWFEPRGLEDIPELKRLFSNDTSLGVGFSPFSTLESLVVDIEKTLNCNEFHKENPQIGSDIKIMGFRYLDDYKITMCVPQIGSAVASVSEYKGNIERVRKIVAGIFEKYEVYHYELDINTRDNYENGELYLTAIGSSIESGDEGMVGRGNRIQGFIAPMRPMSMEGVAGKNPVYHIGKLYYVAAQRISEKIYKRFKIQNEVALVSQSGRDLLDPWIVFVGVPQKYTKLLELESFVKDEIKKIPDLTKELIDLKISIC